MICQVCKSTNVRSSIRANGLRTDYRCGDCGSKKIPFIPINEQDDYKDSKRSIRQQALDMRRIENAEHREEDRLKNAIREYGKEIRRLISERSHIFKRKAVSPLKLSVAGEVGLIQVSDPHCNELIDLLNNKYDFTVAGKRLKKLVDEAVLVFRGRGITKIVVAFTGDLLNSDRRLDEMLSQATNRAKATVASVELFSAFVDDLTNYFEEVEVHGVLGNEGRADKEMTWSDTALSNNYDFTILALMKIALKLNKRVTFGSIDTVNSIINVNGHWVLLTHDIQKATNSQKDTQSTVGRYAISHGVTLRIIMGGHLHATRIGDIAVRCGSLAGSNSFNENSMGLVSFASQILGIFGKETVNIMKVDLQNVDGVVGYDIDETLLAYNIKSATKKLIE